MQSLVQRRCYNTWHASNPSGPARLPRFALVARTASTPLAVRRRRQLKKGPHAKPVSPGSSDANSNGLTPSDLARYQRLLAKGELGGPNSAPTEIEWIRGVNARRSRLRGLKVVRDGSKNASTQDSSALKQEASRTEVAGVPIYLPNIVFKMVPNQTKEGEPYNPYEATFRIPNSVTKTDVRSYLHAVYGVETTYIRTDNYFSPVFRDGTNRRYTKPHRTFKRAVVGLVKPFYYPQRLEDMDEKEREDREKYLENTFAVQRTKNLQKYELLRLTKGDSPDWKWRGTTAIRRGNILRLVAEKRAAREGLIADQVQKWQKMRERGESITVS